MLIYELLHVENQPLWFSLAGLMMLYGIYKISKYLNTGWVLSSVFTLIISTLVPFGEVDFFSTTIFIGSYFTLKELYKKLKHFT